MSSQNEPLGPSPHTRHFQRPHGPESDVVVVALVDLVVDPCGCSVGRLIPIGAIESIVAIDLSKHTSKTIE